MKGSLAALAASFAILANSSAAGAQAQQAKTFQLSKVILDTETTELVARVKGGTWCVFPSNIKIPKEKKTQNYERFDNLFSERMKAGGFAVVNSSNDMFGDADEKNKGDYLVGVILHPVSMNLCSSAAGEKGDISVNADWQIYDRSAGRVVETVSTSGTGAQPKFAADGQKQMFNQAFTANLSSFIEKGVLQRYAGQVAGQGTPAAK
jgi:hypothetical protein